MLSFKEPETILSANTDLALVWLSTKLNLTLKRLNLIYSVYPDLITGLADNFGQIRLQPKTEWLEKFTAQAYATEIEKYAASLENLKIKCLSLLSPDYPDSFRNLSEPPIALFYQGNWSAWQSKQLLTVVGSRNPTFYTKKILQEILGPACQLGVGVISGLAYGTDTLAHQIAVEKQAVTIGVIGSGLDENSFYPKENQHLKEQILDQNGLIISEYTPFTQPNNYNFPKRNRLLAALSELTWVVQAGAKSGSLITAILAQEMGKTVATTPAQIHDQNFSGNLKLLKDGANIISDAEDILQLLGLSHHPRITRSEPEIVFDSEAEKIIWQILSLEPQLTEHLAGKTGLEIQTLNGLLTILELNGLAVCIGENQWIRG